MAPSAPLDPLLGSCKSFAFAWSKLILNRCRGKNKNTLHCTRIENIFSSDSPDNTFNIYLKPIFIRVPSIVLTAIMMCTKPITKR